jgi:YfiH family protein
MINFKFKTSERKDGPMNLLANKDIHWKSPEIDQERICNRAQFLSGQFGIKNCNTVVPKLQHGSVIEAVDKSNFGIAELPCDGLITTTKGLALTVGAGDCYPVMLYDSAKETICLLHCGWRGLSENIITKGIIRLIDDFGANRANIHIQVGPGICKRCYEVNDDVFKAFGRHGMGHGNFNLLSEIESQACVLPSQNVHFSISEHPCTFHNEEYFSARRDGKINGVLKTQMAVAIMQDE